MADPKTAPGTAGVTTPPDPSLPPVPPQTAPVDALAALQAQVAALTNLVTTLAGGRVTAEPALDKNEELHVLTLYPHLRAIDGENKVVVTCVARRGVSTGCGEYLQSGQTSQPIPASIAEKLVASGSVVEGDKPPADLQARQALEIANELQETGGFVDAQLSVDRLA